jgi:hypothetical protein
VALGVSMASEFVCVGGGIIPRVFRHNQRLFSIGTARPVAVEW